MISPKFHALATANTNLVFLEVDVDQVAEVAQQVGIEAMPTFKVFKHGKEIDNMVGANIKGLEAMIVKHGGKTA
jgi:thioredoxin 1